MKALNCKTALFIIVSLFFSSCNIAETSRADDPPASKSVVPKTDLSKIDLTKIGPVKPKGRVQDKDLNQLPIIDDLLAHGKDSIPFLIGKLDDETKIDGHVFDFWYQTSVGDVALVILTNFFYPRDGQSTIPGVGWGQFLERGNDKDSTGEAVLRNYIEKYGRRKIKQRWQKIWDENKANIFWDEKERCFRVGSLSSQTALKDAFKSDFLIGAALNRSQIYGEDAKAGAIIETHFNTISPENALKWESVHPKSGQYDFEAADRYVAFGLKNKMFIVGHALVWHNQTPDVV